MDQRIDASDKLSLPSGGDPSLQLEPSPGNSGNGIIWLIATMVLVLSAWYLGPLVIERYQYAATRGRVTAEFEKATEILEGLPLNDVSMAFELVAQRIRPSVVSVRAEGVLDRQDGSSGNGQGSGVIMSSDGYLLTNKHVVEGASRILIGLHDRRQFEGTLVGTDTISDLAVIKIDATGLFAANWGDSDRLRVGSMVWAVGSPYGLEQTVTSGILSARERGDSLDRTREYLQTDAAVNPGNSGGPLVNSLGEVVGINTSIYGDQFQGISFAIPSATAQFVFEEIIGDGKVNRSFLGIRPSPVNHDQMTRLSLPDLNGAFIDEIPRGGPASYSGLRRGDVIRTWDGRDVKTYNMLFRFIEMTEPELPVEVEIYRDGQPQTLELSVGARDDYIN
ncbi:MAG: S1C family serine protease [Pirellulaceae bacterium]